MSGFFLRISGFALFDCTAHFLKFYKRAKCGAGNIHTFGNRTLSARRNQELQDIPEHESYCCEQTERGSHILVVLILPDNCARLVKHDEPGKIIIAPENHNPS